MQKYIQKVTIKEKFATFLFIVNKGASNRTSQKQFFYSKNTISRYVIIYLCCNYLKPINNKSCVDVFTRFFLLWLNFILLLSIYLMH